MQIKISFDFYEGGREEAKKEAERLTKTKESSCDSRHARLQLEAIIVLVVDSTGQQDNYL